MENNPLVSIVVATYNSSHTILETLDSVFYQTYQNVELIVSDDCSRDTTASIVKDWISSHKKRFVKCLLVETSQNTGVSGNFNRGIKASSGDWIKIIAGDDVLETHCIQLNVDFVNNTNANVVFSKVKHFRNSINTAYIPPLDYSFFSLSPKKQLHLLRRQNQIPCAPSTFINKKVLNHLGCFDERFPMMEDYPMWVKLLRNGYNLSFLNEYTVFYRVEGESITNSSQKYLNPLFFSSYENFFKLELFPIYKWNDLLYMLHVRSSFMLCNICIHWFDNKPSLLFRVIYILFRMFDLYWYIDFFKVRRYKRKSIIFK